MAQTNIIYLHSHDTGRCVSPYGWPTRTPNLEAFAASGVTFRQGFTNAPTCSPSRACLLTGTTAHQSGMVGLAHLGGRLRDPSTTIPSVLGRAGYETVIAGHQHVVHPPRGPVGDPDEPLRRLGYSRVLAGEMPPPSATELAAFPGSRPPDAQAVIHSVRYLEEWASGDRERPFFLDCGHFATHRTGPPKPTGRPFTWHNDEGAPLGDPRGVLPPAPLPDTPRTRQDFADFLESVARLDKLHGSVLDALDRLGLAGETFVFITTDHGIAFPGMKCNLADAGTGVLLMARGPGGFEGGRVVDAMVQHRDVLPTICDLAGIPAPEWAAGRSLRPLVDGRLDPSKSDALHSELFFETNYHASYEPARAVRTARYKFIRRWDAGASPVLPNIDDSLTKIELLEAGWGARPNPREALYDLLLDPLELVNLCADPGHASVRDDLAARLEHWMLACGDPLLKPGGRVPFWPGSIGWPSQLESHYGVSPTALEDLLSTAAGKS